MLKRFFLSFGLLTGAIVALAQPQMVCPVRHEPTPEGAKTAVYRGLQFSFCCPPCEDEFLKEPSRLLSEARDKNLVVAETLFDVVTQKRLEGKPAFTTDYAGVRYGFAAEESLKEFLAGPELFAAPANESLTCPVMKVDLASAAQASDYSDHKGVRYYFCCLGCRATFEADPEKFAKDVADKVKTTNGTSTKFTDRHVMAPTCAGCAGEARMLGPDGIPLKWTFGYRFIGAKDPALRHRFTLDYAINNRLSVGIERAGAERRGHGHADTSTIGNYLRTSDANTFLLPRATWFVTPEGPNHPSVVIGTASDRLSTHHGQAYFVTAGKSIPGGRVMPFVSVKLETYRGRVAFPFGVNVSPHPDWTLQTIHDGDYTHMLLTRMFETTSVSAVLGRMKYPGIAISWGFK